MSRIVPSAERGDWREEWEAEFDCHHAERGSGGARLPGPVVAGRCLGAVVHAAWLRKEEWSLDMLLQDLRYALRILAGRPAFTLMAALTLALGIGANTTIFSVVHAVLLKPLPYQDADRLVQLWETNPHMNWTEATIAPANLLDWRERNRVFDGIAIYFGSETRDAGHTNYTLTEGSEAERLRGLQVSANFFTILGVQPAAGRDFLPAEEQPGQHRVIILSHGLWQRRFASRASIVGDTVSLGGAKYLVAGIMPAGFRFPGGEADFWAPLAFQPEQFRTLRRPHFLRAVARLKPGVTVEQAGSDMTRIAADLEREYPDTNTKMGVGLGPLEDWFVGNTRRPLLLFLGAVGFLMLIACANVANLMLARAAGRTREVAIRTALGAARLRLVRQLMTESLLLSLVGGALGLLVAVWGVQAFVKLSPPNVPRLDEVAIDPRVLLFTIGLTFGTALLFGFAPALHLAGAHPADSLYAGSRGDAPRGRRIRRILVVSEVALAFVLVIGSALMVRSFLRLQRVDPGFDPSNVVTATISLPPSYDNDAKRARFFEQALDRVRTVPGVSSAGAAARVALDGYAWTGDLSIEGRPDFWGRELRHKSVVSGYFDAMRLPLVAGRDVSAADTAEAPLVVIVNDAFVRTHLSGEEVLGRRISYTRPTGRPEWRTIVGIVADEKQDGLDVPTRPEVYEPHQQEPRGTMTLAVRVAAPLDAVVPLVRAAVRQVDPGVALYDVRTMDERLAEAVGRQRLNLWLFGFFGAAALILAAIGVFGVVSSAVSSRLREIGVRVAIGATRRDIIRLCVADGITVSAIGLLIGLPLAIWMSRVVESLLFETTSTDPLTFLAVTVLLGAVALVASYVPARAALRVDPLHVLKAE